MTTVVTYGYCGMPIPHGSFEDAGAARTKAARIIRLRRRQGFPVSTLVSGQRWEVQEPEGCFMVPDNAGILELAEEPEQEEEFDED